MQLENLQLRKSIADLAKNITKKPRPDIYEAVRKDVYHFEREAHIVEDLRNILIEKNLSTQFVDDIAFFMKQSGKITHKQYNHLLRVYHKFTEYPHAIKDGSQYKDINNLDKESIMQTAKITEFISQPYGDHQLGFCRVEMGKNAKFLLKVCKSKAGHAYCSFITVKIQDKWVSTFEFTDEEFAKRFFSECNSQIKPFLSPPVKKEPEQYDFTSEHEKSEPVPF
jgi:hypothetical protein